jgi:hypothetical protein
VSILRIDADRELLVRGAPYATDTAFGEDEPVSTANYAAAPGKVADVVIDLDAVTVTGVTERRSPLDHLARSDKVNDDPSGWGS